MRMKHDYFAFLKANRFNRVSYTKFVHEHNLYFLHAKRDVLWDNKPGDDRALFFKHKDTVYNLCPEFLSLQVSQVGYAKFLNGFNFKITIKSPFFTASENKFYSISNSIAKERPIGIPVLKGSSLKGALRQAAVDVLESELLEKNYGGKLQEWVSKSEEEIIAEEQAEQEDKFWFKKRARLVRLFGNEKDEYVRWFTFKSLLATGGIRDMEEISRILNKISNAFSQYLKYQGITDGEGNCKGRLIFEDLHFKKVALDVITPLDRKKRTPVHGPIYYEVVPAGEITVGKILWFPFDLIAKEEIEKVDEEWEKDKEIIKNAFNRLKELGIGAKTKDGWGRFEWEEI